MRRRPSVRPSVHRPLLIHCGSIRRRRWKKQLISGAAVLPSPSSTAATAASICIGMRPMSSSSSLSPSLSPSHSLIVVILITAFTHYRQTLLAVRGDAALSFSPSIVQRVKTGPLSDDQAA